MKATIPTNHRSNPTHPAAGKAASPSRKLMCSLALATGLVTLSALFATQSAYAASATWNGTSDAMWANATNWSASPVPGTGDTATFNNAGNSNVIIDLDAGVIIQGITFDTASAAAYTIGSGVAGSQTLALDPAGLIKMNSTTGNNQLVNAAIVLGTPDTTDSFTFTNEKVTGTLTFAGGINSGGNAGSKFLTVNGVGATIISGDISDGSGMVGLSKSGTGTLTLSGTNAYTGGTVVGAGTLSFLKTAAMVSSGTTTVSANATLGLGVSGAGAFTSADVDSLFADSLTGVSMVSGSNVGIDTSEGDFIHASNIPVPPVTMGLTKLGPNKLTITGVNQYSGSTTVVRGTLEMTGGSITSDGNFYGAINSNQPTTIMTGGSVTLTAVGGVGNRVTVGQGNVGSPSTLVMGGTATFTTAGNFSVGGNAGGASGSGECVMKDSAVLTVQSTANLGFYVQGDGASGTSRMLLQDNAIVNANRLTVSSNFGSLTQTGGQVNVTYSSAPGNFNRIANGQGRWAWYNMTAGTLNFNANPGGPGLIVSVGTNRGLGFMNITGTAAVNMAADVDFRLCSNQTGTLGFFGEVNLAGGTLTTPKVTCPDIGGDVWGGVFNFNGGTLKAAKDEANFMRNLKGVRNATPGAAYVYAGGAVIDTNGFAITIAQPLLEPAGQGVTSVSVNPGTQTYVAPPIVEFQDAPASMPARAQGFATLDADGHINGIVMTKPGFGYTAVPTVTFNPNLGGASATTTIGEISGGGLTKNGTGTLTLSGINTYTGDTVVNDGSLVLADDAGLTFKIGANGVNNKIRGTAAVQLDGDFTIDLSGAAAAVGNSWTLVNVSTLTATFGATFTVAGAWAEASDVWTLPDGDNAWTFTEATGVLTYTGAATPYDTWAAGTFANPFTDKDPTHDPDHDGLSNQQEFAFGLDPTTGASANPITAPLDKSSHKFSYTRYAASGLSYTVWTSANLQGWAKVLPADMIENAGTPNSAGVATVEVTLTAPPAGDQLFVRVQAQ
ncbi:MAG: autotransporter-associated beta strand repeat-containing protein [Verrucomicrobia bacterium]|nr:autotransporter-associated beta strand repeat-containing protein [Verrucomicrobiota bacterium]